MRTRRANDATASVRSVGRGLSETVVAAVAEYKGVDAVELDPPLYRAIDPDALDRLFRESRGTVRLNIWGCAITIDDDGVVTVTEGDDIG
jgi:hypothetical protein